MFTCIKLHKYLVWGISTSFGPRNLKVFFIKTHFFKDLRLISSFHQGWPKTKWPKLVLSVYQLFWFVIWKVKRSGCLFSFKLQTKTRSKHQFWSIGFWSPLMKWSGHMDQILFHQGWLTIFGEKMKMFDLDRLGKIFGTSLGLSNYCRWSRRCLIRPDWDSFIIDIQVIVNWPFKAKYTFNKRWQFCK